MITSDFRIVEAREADVPIIVGMIRALADFEKMSDELVATEAGIAAALFGPRRYAEVVIGRVGTEAVGYALFFHNFSTFRGAPGLYLEDLFVYPQWRGRGFGGRLLAHLAAVAVDRGCHRMEWSVLDWNARAIDFYSRAGAQLLTEWRICRLSGDSLRSLGAGRAGSAGRSGRPAHQPL